jgi:ubiquinone biosynthesis protein
MFFNHTISNISRLRKLIEVLLKYGFEDVVNNTRLRSILSPKKKAGALIEEEKRFLESRWERARLVLEELGPTYIKLGQLLSNRPDLLPEPLIKELEKLQDTVPPFDVAVAKRIIEAEIDQPLHEAFVYFDDKPLGSASIGQVHRARLASGEDVVVKVRRPNARRQVVSDLVLLKEFIKLTEGYFVKNGILNPLEIVDTFSKSLINELDYSLEAKNLDQFQVLFGKMKQLVIPKVYRAFSTKKVLTIEFIGGCKVTDVAMLKSWGLDPAEIARTGLDLYLTQIFDYGLFHADPHPGNVLVKPNGAIALIDFGTVGKLIPSQKYAFAGLFIALANKDATAMAINLRRLAIDHEIDDMRAFEYDLNDLIQDYVLLEPFDMGVKEFAGRLQKIVYTYKLKIPGIIFLILRALAILEGIARTLDPTFDVLENIKPYGFRLLAEQFSIKNIRKELSHSVVQLFTLFYNLPLEVRDIVKQVRKGKILINMQLHGHENALRHLDLAANRLVMGLIISALILSAAIIYGNSIGHDAPGIWGIPYLSLFFMLIAMFVTLLLLVNDIRSKRNKNL